MVNRLAHQRNGIEQYYSFRKQQHRDEQPILLRYDCRSNVCRDPGGSFIGHDGAAGGNCITRQLTFHDDKQLDKFKRYIQRQYCGFSSDMVKQLQQRVWRRDRFSQLGRK